MSAKVKLTTKYVLQAWNGPAQRWTDKYSRAELEAVRRRYKYYEENGPLTTRHRVVRRLIRESVVATFT